MALPTASDNKFPKLIVQEAANDGSDFSNPAADYRVLFLGEDGVLHLKDSSGTVTTIGGSTPAFVGAKGTNTAGSTMTDATETVVPYATEDYDTTTFHDTGSNTSRLTVGSTGYYRVTAQYAIASATYTAIYAALRKNANAVGGAGTLLAIARPDAIASTALGQIVWEGSLTSADYVELFVNQNSGGNRALRTAAGENWFAIQYLGA